MSTADNQGASAPEELIVGDPQPLDGSETLETPVEHPPVSPETAEEEQLVVGDPQALGDDDMQTKRAFMKLDPLPPSLTVQQDDETFMDLGKVKWVDSIETLAIPEDTPTRTDEVMSSFPNVDIAATEQGEEWAEYLRRSTVVRTRGNWFGEIFDRDGSAWRQSVESQKGKLHAAFPTFKDEVGTKITGERAMLRVRALVGLGSMIHVPLWHSGFWITLKAPPDGELLELHQRLAQEKIQLGRQTWGLSFANNSVFLAAWVTDFILNNSYGTTLKDPADLRKKISSLDIPTLVWGIACVIWPRGFQYARSVLDQGEEQYRVIKEKLNIPKLFWTDTTALTPWQISHMGNRSGPTMSAETVQRYRDEFTRGKGREIELRPGLKLMLRVPSLDQYVNSGQKWVNNIVAMTDRVFQMDNDQSRDAYIVAQGKATNMRQFGHWVESIDAEGRLIADEQTIESTLDALSADDELRKEFFEEVRKFMEESTVSTVAVPAVTQGEREKELPRFPHLLPLDTMSTFFILLVQKTLLIQSRQ